MTAAAAPEEGGGFLGDEPSSPPFSPSVFLDLPPTPRLPSKDIDADDVVVDLDFISRILMEDDIDGRFFHDNELPGAILEQRQYAQALLSGEPAGSSDSTSLSSSDGNGTNNSSTEPIDDTSNLSLPGDGAATAEFFQQSPPLFDGAVSDFVGADIQSSPLLDGGVSGHGAQARAMLTHYTDGHNKFLPGDDWPGSLGFQPTPVLGADAAFFDATNQSGVISFSLDTAGEDGGRADDGIDMLNMAFAKGVEEANRFLRGSNTLLDATCGIAGGGQKKEEAFVERTMLSFGNGRGRKNRHDADVLAAETGRSSKLMTPDREEPGALKLYDEMMLQEYEMCMRGMEKLRVDMDAEKKIRKSRRGMDEAVDLHTMLLHCAQAVAMGDRRSADELLKQIKLHTTPRGDATQRLAHYFAEALEARLAGDGSQLYQSIATRHISAMEYLKGYKLFAAACSFRQAVFAFSSKTIYDIMVGKSRLHIVDYGVQYGLHWPTLLKMLGERDGGPPEVRITGIDLPEPGFRPAYQVEETGRRLANCARKFGVPFKYRGIATMWEKICAEDLNIEPDEVLVVSAQSGFGKLMDESVVMDRPNPRDVVVSNIREMQPDVYIEVVLNGTYGAPFFVTRFREAMFFYSTHFDMMDATTPRNNDDRLLIEQGLFRKWIMNIVACEGTNRVDRPETYKQWQVRNHQVGLRQLPLNPEAVQLVTDKVKNHYHKDFHIYVDRGWLLQGWKGRVLWALSTWVSQK